MSPKDIRKDLEKLYESLQPEMRQKWDRDVPFEELLFDRWDRAGHLGFGDGSNIYHNSYVYGDVNVGENTWIGPFTIIDGTGGLTIGDNCCISSGVHIYSHNTVKRFVSGGKEKSEFGPVVIGDCCFIGPQSVINSGVTIGKHSVIGACSFVNKDIPSYSIAVGTPACVVGRVHINEDQVVSFEYFAK